MKSVFSIKLCSHKTPASNVGKILFRLFRYHNFTLNLDTQYTCNLGKFVILARELYQQIFLHYAKTRLHETSFTVIIHLYESYFTPG